MPFPLYKVPKVKRPLRLSADHAKALGAKVVEAETPTTETPVVTEVPADKK